MESSKPHDSCEVLVMSLIGAMGRRSLFYRDHPRVQSAIAEFVRCLETHLQASAKPEFFLGLAKDRLVHDGRLLFSSSLLGRKLIVFAERLHCGGFVFRAPLRDADVMALLDLYAELRGPLASLQDARERLKQNTAAIQLLPPYKESGWSGAAGSSEGGAEKDTAFVLGNEVMAGVYQSMFDVVETAHGQAARDSSVDLNSARSIAEVMLKSADGRLHDMLRLVRYPTYDSYTVGHSVRVALLAVQIGQTLKLESRYLLELGTAGLLHDVGKAKIPQEILFKHGRLNEEERCIISHHPRIGAELLMEQKDAGPLSIGAAFGHHLRQDAKGYPVIPSWHAVGRSTALIHVCDVFEALTAIRPYKPAFSPRRAFEIMLADTGCFHPGALSALVRSVGLFPPGSHVLMSTGERAMVVAAGEELDRPCVSITHDRGGALLQGAAHERRDLAKIEPRELSIVRLIDDGPRPSATLDDLKQAC
jgi:HD-GYP domain-containing protein (c-di-GMP phosphodiesterase class II)